MFLAAVFALRGSGVARSVVVVSSRVGVGGAVVGGAWSGGVRAGGGLRKSRRCNEGARDAKGGDFQFHIG